MNRHTEKLAQVDEQAASKGLQSLNSASPNSPSAALVKTLSQFTAAAHKNFNILAISRINHSVKSFMARRVCTLFLF